MGSGSFDSTNYSSGVAALKATGTTYARSASASRTGDYTPSEKLDPRKLKNGLRESCYVPGFNDATAIIVSIDGTGSMEQVPVQVQESLPTLIDLLTEKGVSDHPNLMFMMHDDENCFSDAVFQMSQFEIDPKKVLESLNELIIPGNGGGNGGESYHLSFYAAANHTRCEAFEKNGEKGFFIMICDELPYFNSGNPEVRGTSAKIAKELFGDVLEKEVSMLESIKKTAEKFHVFVIRPQHTSNGRNKSITKQWQDLLSKAGVNREHVMEIEETSTIIPTIAMAIGRLLDVDESDLVDVLNAKGATGVADAVNATKSIVAIGSSTKIANCVTSDELVTSDGSGRARR